jgi:hypothetical protein
LRFRVTRPSRGALALATQLDDSALAPGVRTAHRLDNYAVYK